MNTKYKLGVLVLTTLLLVSIVSAWPFSAKVTGNVIADQTAIEDIAKCEDRDGGVFASVPGATFYFKSWFGSSITGDKCEGKKISVYDSSGKRISNVYGSIRETYCDSTTGKDASQIMNASDLGEGYCIFENIKVENKNVRSAKWISLNFQCTDNDDKEDKNIPGIVTFNNGTEISFSDKCSADKKSVIQYKCDQRKQAVVAKVANKEAVACGENRECAISSNGAAYCKDKYAPIEIIGETNSSLTELNERVAALEQTLNDVNGKFNSINVNTLTMISNATLQKSGGQKTLINCEMLCSNDSKSCISALVHDYIIYESGEIVANEDLVSCRGQIVPRSYIIEESVHGNGTGQVSLTCLCVTP